MTDNIPDAGKETESPEGDIPDATPDDRVSNATPEGSDLKSDQEDTFTRDYVEGLRQENGKYRQRAAHADELAQRLHTELVRATGRLADPSDLAFDEDHIANAGKMIAAIDELLTRKPHLATRKPSGEIGQGAARSGSSVDLAAILRGNAG